MKKVWLIIELVILTAGTLATAVAQAPANVEDLRGMLLSQGERGYLVGHHDDPMYGHDWKFEEGKSDVLAVTGHYPALMTFDLGHIELGDAANLDGVPFDRIREEIKKQYERGGIVSLSWHADNPVTGKSAWDNSDSTVVRQILKNKAVRRKFTGWLDRLADYLLTIPQPIVFRPWHEHTGSWFWWGQQLCSKKEYLDLWKLTVGHLKKRGVSNLVYAYSPGIEPKSTAEYLERYPGDKIVTLIGVDAYHYNGLDGTQEFQLNLGRMLRIMQEVCRTHHVAMALTECGMESITDPHWFTQTLAPVISKYPLAYVQFWRNAHDNPTHFYTPYPGHTSAADFRQFCSFPKAIMVK